MNKIVLISSYCDTEEKCIILKDNITKIKSLGLDVMLNSPIILPIDIITECDYFFLTKDNPILNWPKKAVYVWNKTFVNNTVVTKNKCLSDFGWANIYQVKKLTEFALSYDYEYFYHIIYDLVIDNTVIDAFLSDKKCNFYHFHEHNVSLHLMCFNRENLLKFLPNLTLESYLKNGGIAEAWLNELLLNKIFYYTLENSYVDDKILYHGHDDYFNYSKIDDVKFFIIKDAMNLLNNIELYFYDIDDINIKINNIDYIIMNDTIVDLMFNSENIKNVIIEYNNITQDITNDIINISNNTIDFK